VYLVVAGEFYENESDYRKMIPNTLADRILIVNRFLPDDELNQAIYHSDYVVLPYRSGTQSGILAQSIALGTPVLSSKLPGLSMYLEEGKTGLTFPVAEKSSVIDLVLELIEGERTYSWDQVNFEEARRRWSWERFGALLKDSLVNQLH
jgi:glycosyltransferase involved in cell wall biosynthesis